MKQLAECLGIQHLLVRLNFMQNVRFLLSNGFASSEMSSASSIQILALHWAAWQTVTFTLGRHGMSTRTYCKVTGTHMAGVEAQTRCSKLLPAALAGEQSSRDTASIESPHPEMVFSVLQGPLSHSCSRRLIISPIQTWMESFLWFVVNSLLGMNKCVQTIPEKVTQYQAFI